MALRAQWLTVFGVVFGAIALCWFFPLFHVRRIGHALDSQSSRDQKTSVPRTLQEFELFVVRVDVKSLWSAYDTDLTSIQKQYGHQVGLGGAWYYCVEGTGRVESVDQNSATLAIEGSPRRVRIELGVVVDNTVRDAFAVKASQFDNAQDFNALSSELNQQVEQSVIQAHRAELVSGANMAFIGCAKVASKSDLDPLRLIPVRLKRVDGEPEFSQPAKVGAP